MLVLATCFVIWKFIALTEAVENARSVHVALETALTFNKKDSSSNIKFIDDFQDFLSKIRNTVVKTYSKDTPSRRNYRENLSKTEARVTSAVTNLKFTEFIIELISILKNYKDDDLEDVIAVINDEIRKYHYKGCKFHELLTNNNLRRLVADKLNLVKEVPGKALRNNLDQTLRILQKAKFDSEKSELLDYIDSLYTRNDGKKLQKTLGYFHLYKNKYKRINMDLKALVRESIRSVIFDHYSNLKPNTRRDLKARLETFFWQNVNQKDNLRQLKRTINYNQQVGNLKEQTYKHTASTEKEHSNEEEASNEKEDPDSAPSNRNKNNPSNNLNLIMYFENQMDIVKLGKASINEKKDKPKVVKEGSEFDEENNEKIESEEERESATALDKHNVSGEGHVIENTVNKYIDDASKNGDDFSNEVNLPTKGKQYSKSKYLIPLTAYKNDFSAEIERDKEQKAKGFTHSSIRSGNKNIYEKHSGNDAELAKPKKKKYKMATTLGSRYRVHTLWEEAYTTNKPQENTDEEVSETENSYDIVKPTKMTDTLRSQKERENLKFKKNINKYRPKSTNVIDSGMNVKIGFSRNNKIKKAMKQDFSLQANLENISPVDGQGMEFKLVSSKNTDSNKKILRMEIKKDEKPEKTTDGTTSSELKLEEEDPVQDKSSDEFKEQDNSHEFTKQHTNKKTQSKIKHETNETTTSEEELTTITKSSNKLKKSTTTRSPTTLEKQSDEKSTENENYSKEEEMTTSKRTRRPKKTKTIKKQTTTPKSVVKSKKEDYESSEEPNSTTKNTKTKKIHKKPKSTTPNTETTEKSSEEVSESTEKEINKKKHKKRKKSSKRHINKKKDERIEISSDEKHLDSQEETNNQNILLSKKMKAEEHSESKEKETPIQSLISNENNKEERKKDGIKSLPKPIKRETIKPTTDIFISVESQDYSLIKRFKTVSNRKLTTKLKELSTEFTTTPTTPTTKEANYKEAEESKENDKSTKTSKSDHDDSKEKDDSIEFKISKPTSTHPVETTDTLTSTPKILTTGKNHQIMELPTTLDTYNKDPLMRASKEKLANKTDANKESSSEEIVTKTSSKSYLQLIDLLHDGQTMVVNLDSLKPYPTADNTKVNRTDFRYPLSDFWNNYYNRAKMKTTATDSATTRSIPTTQLTTITATTKEHMNEKKKRKKKKKKRTTEYTTTTEATTEIFTTAITQPIRRNIDVTKKPNGSLENVNNMNNTPDYDKEIEDYYNGNNTIEHYENVTKDKDALGGDLQEFLDLQGIKLDEKNGTDVNLDAVNELLGSKSVSGQPNIEAEVKDEKARIALDRDMLKLYGETVSHIEISTTPWNTLFTDPIDGLNQEIDQKMKSLNQNLII